MYRIDVKNYQIIMDGVTCARMARLKAPLLNGSMGSEISVFPDDSLINFLVPSGNISTRYYWRRKKDMKDI